MKNKRINKALKEAAAVLGRMGGIKGGKSRSPAKLAAARANGAKGGRPRKESRENDRRD